MKKSTYTLLVVCLLTASVIMGLNDGGDITAAVVLAMLFLPPIFDNKKVKRNVKTK